MENGERKTESGSWKTEKGLLPRFAVPMLGMDERAF